MKHCITLKNVVEIFSLQAYFILFCKDYKNLYLICQANLFTTPKLHFTTPNEVVTHSLRSPVLNN